MAEEITPAVSTDDDIADVSLLDTPLTQPVAPPAAEPPADPAEEQGAGDTEPTETTPEPASGDVNGTETTAEQPPEQPQAEQQPVQQRTDEQRKEAARNAYLERQRRRNEVERQINDQFAPKTEDQLVEEGMDPAQAQIQALREEMQFNTERARIAELNASMQADSVNVLADFPVFDEKSPNYDKDFAEMVNSRYQLAARVTTQDVTGPDGTTQQIVTSADVPLYDFYKQMNDLYSHASTRAATAAEAKGKDDTLAMLARTETPGSSSNAGVRGPETLEDMEARLADMPII